METLVYLCMANQPSTLDIFLIFVKQFICYIILIILLLCVVYDIVSYCNSPNHIVLELLKADCSSSLFVVNYWLVSSGMYKMKLRHFFHVGYLAVYACA